MDEERSRRRDKKRRRKRAEWYANERRYMEMILFTEILIAVRLEPREKHDSIRWRRVVLSFIPPLYTCTTKMIRGRRKVLVKRVDKGSIYYITKLRAPRQGHHVGASYCFRRVRSLLPRDENSLAGGHSRIRIRERGSGHMLEISPDIVNRSSR